MISVIIVSYNKPELLRQTLLSLKSHHHQNMEIIVVDNSDQDDVKKMINKEFKDVIIIRMESNIGFGRANNIGIQLSKGDYIAFLNNDLIFKEDVISPLVSEIEIDSSLGIIGPKLCNKDMSLQYSCCNFPSVSDIIKSESWGDYSVNRWYLTDWDHNQRRYVDYISGALMVMRRDLIENIGLFDNIFFMYSEEVDLCYRIKKAGYHIEYFPAVEAIHFGGASTILNNREINSHLYLSRLKFRLKHYGICSTLSQILGITIVSIIRCLFVFVKILVIKKNRDLRISQLIRTLKKLKLMFICFITLVSRNNRGFFDLHNNPI
jgi:GT2 family glycosyltransferase